MANRQWLGSGDTVAAWARYLGLAAKPLFGYSPGTEASDHYALLNGRDASFACSEGWEIEPEVSRNWQWSADLAHHVVILDEEVHVRSGRDYSVRRFSRRSVESRLEDFLGYLDSPSHPALPDVVRFLLGEFEQIWAALPNAADKGHLALAAFLTAVEAAGNEHPEIFTDITWRADRAAALRFEPAEIQALRQLPQKVVERAITMVKRTPLNLRLNPTLVLRHAGGRLFQEAHGYLESVQPDLFGDATVTRVVAPSPTGAYFTPVPIARFLAEAALSNLENLPDDLVVADYACGSAVFLAEMLHVLERLRYRGRVTLVGRDVSSEAVVMARVAIAAASSGITDFEIRVDVRRVDSIQDQRWPQANIALMNPPFRSWEQMDDVQREWVRSAMGGTHRGRPDLAVGFIEHAVGALRDGGVLATLLPAGLLGAESLADWRGRLAEQAAPQLIAILGEHGLFRHALVNIGVLVARKSVASADEPLYVAWSASDPGAASVALRALRRSGYAEAAAPMQADRPSWSITETTLEQWRRRPSWLPGPGLMGPLLTRIETDTPTMVETLFHVRQGIRTGRKGVFVLSAAEYLSLDKTERSYFAPAADNSSFDNGAVEPRNYVFVGDEKWESAEDVKRAVPNYYQRWLSPAMEELKSRRGIDPQKWWRLTRGRGWMFDGTPRLVSKRFGLSPSFARDFDGRLAVLQANAWIPKQPLTRGVSATEVESLLTLYWWLLNSDVAVALFREYCPNVAGGQLDLENKYVKHVPLPDLRRRVAEDPSMQGLVANVMAASSNSLPSKQLMNAFAAAAYRTSLSDWPLA